MATYVGICTNNNPLPLLVKELCLLRLFSIPSVSLALCFFSLFSAGCRFLEHAPYYLNDAATEDEGIQKLAEVLSETEATIRQITQNAQDLWQDTGILLKRDEYVQIQSQGSWGCMVEKLGRCGPEGNGSDTEDRFPWCALLGKLGPAGKPFLVGRLCTFKALREGNLFLIMNDGVDCYHNNSGKMDISVAMLGKGITVSKKTPITETTTDVPKLQVECRIQLLHLASGATYGEVAAGCYGLEKIPELAAFLTKKLAEKTMVRQERVGILPLVEKTALSRQHQLGKSIRQNLYGALATSGLFRLIEASSMDKLLNQENPTLEQIRQNPEAKQSVDYLLIGEVSVP